MLCQKLGETSNILHLVIWSKRFLHSVCIRGLEEYFISTATTNIFVSKFNNLLSNSKK
jgi:hypothetical protein